jgi:thymidylate synthase ThyX
MQVELIAITRYLKRGGTPEELLEHAGRVCYRSEARGDPGRFLRARIREGHESLVEHASATFEIVGLSRAASHQLVRHRLASFSQESQRYCQYGALEPDLAPQPAPLPEAKGEKRHGHCRFTVTQEQFITHQYQQGVSCDRLAVAYDVHPTTIRDIVNRNEGSIREMSEAKTLHADTKYFAEIDNPQKAYLLGLIYADGNVAYRDDKPSHSSIAQHSDWAAWLRRLGALWGGAVISAGREGLARLTIPGKEAAEHLTKHGVARAKSHVLTGPVLDDDLISHFIRGYLEGDGYIGLREPRVTITSGSPELLKWMLQRTRVATDKGSLSDRGRVFDLNWGGGICVSSLLNWLYQGFDFRLSHPAKLERVIRWSEVAENSYNKQVALWANKFEVVVPPRVQQRPTTMSLFVEAIETAAQGYANLRALGIRKEDVRFALPNAAATRVVMTMNFRELLHLFRLRISSEAQWEIRELCVRMLELVCPHAPNVFGDLREELRTRHPSFFECV